MSYYKKLTAREIRKSYYDLLKTPEWHIYREQFLARNPDCEFCDQEAQHPHHRKYRDILPWEYPDSDMSPVCSHCHDVIHACADELWNHALGLPPHELEARIRETKEARHTYNLNSPVRKRVERAIVNDDLGVVT